MPASTQSPWLDFLAQYPPWLVVSCGTIAAAAFLWILGKLLKWAFRLLLVAVVLGGGMLAAWTFFKR